MFNQDGEDDDDDDFDEDNENAVDVARALRMSSVGCIEEVKWRR